MLQYSLQNDAIFFIKVIQYSFQNDNTLYQSGAILFMKVKQYSFQIDAILFYQSDLMLFIKVIQYSRYLGIMHKNVNKEITDCQIEMHCHDYIHVRKTSHPLRISIYTVTSVHADIMYFPTSVHADIQV